MLDLGVPELEPQSAFLIKFVMSFFQTLGMEINDQGFRKGRFNVAPVEAGERLALTTETEEKIRYLRGVCTMHCTESVRTIRWRSGCGYLWDQFIASYLCANLPHSLKVLYSTV